MAEYASKGVAGTALGLGIASLQALVGKITQINIPTSAICPEVMPRYNSWTAPTTTTPT